MTLSEVKGKDALNLLADILDPIVEISTDPEVEKVYRSGKNMDVIKTIIKLHADEILYVMAKLDGQNPETYEPSLAEIPVKLITLFNDPAFVQFFPSRGQKTDKTSSGSATENTEGPDES